MDTRHHPDHNKIWIILVVILIALSAIPFGLAFHFDNQTTQSNSAFDISVILFMVLLGSAGVAGALGSYISKCPDCKRWIKRYREADQDDDRILFVCRTCNSIFDTGVRESRY
jgi:peptidoglycan/LPS O-acetylase OafA/YrhL